MKNLVGKVFGKLSVIRFIEKRKNNPYWLCQCNCGTFRQIAGNALMRTKYSTKSCGCSKIIRMKNLNRLENGLSAKRRIFAFYKKGAKARDFQFNLSFEQLVEFLKKSCHYCGIEPSNSSATINPHGASQILYNGIDRIDNSKGYIVENLVSCCKNCNYAKFDLSYEEFKIYLKRLGEYYVKTHSNMLHK
jgi:hypothetical protein